MRVSSDGFTNVQIAGASAFTFFSVTFRCLATPFAAADSEAGERSEERENNCFAECATHSLNTPKSGPPF